MYFYYAENKGDVFKTIIPLTAEPGAHAGEHASAHADEHGETQDMTAKILEFCREPKTRSEIQEFLDIKSRIYFSQKVLSLLIKVSLPA